MTNQVIPEAAVEAAAKALVREQTRGCYAYKPEGHPKRKDIDKYAYAHARAALEAAAPHMLAAAWDEGLSHGFNLVRNVEDPKPNPYR